MKNKSFIHIYIFIQISFNIILRMKNLEYKKNKNIKMSEKSPDSSLNELENISSIENKISENSNFLLLFYTNPNKHW